MWPGICKDVKCTKIADSNSNLALSEEILKKEVWRLSGNSLVVHFNKIMPCWNFINKTENCKEILQQSAGNFFTILSFWKKAQYGELLLPNCYQIVTKVFILWESHVMLFFGKKKTKQTITHVKFIAIFFLKLNMYSQLSAVLYFCSKFRNNQIRQSRGRSLRGWPELLLHLLGNHPSPTQGSDLLPYCPGNNSNWEVQLQFDNILKKDILPYTIYFKFTT